MTATSLHKAKQTLARKIADQLNQSLVRSGGLMMGKPKASLAFGVASKNILEVLLADRESIVALTSLLQAKPGTRADEPGWLTTDEAAKKLGFSRPYVAALIDAGEFGTDAYKTPKGHRRVKISAVEKWLRDHEVSPARKAKAAAISEPEIFDTPKLSAKRKAALNAQLEQMRANSRTHRPARNRA